MRRITWCRSSAARSAPRRQLVQVRDQVGQQLKGLRFRAAGLGGKVAQKAGMSVTLLPGGELFQALEKGVLDGTEFSLPTVDEQLGFYKVAKFYHLPGWH